MELIGCLKKDYNVLQQAAGLDLLKEDLLEEEEYFDLYTILHSKFQSDLQFPLLFLPTTDTL